MSTKKIRPRYLRLSEETNALDYLERAVFYIHQAENKTVFWKWVVISLHGALYGFSICACKGTSPENVTFKTKRGDEKLIGINEALKRCQNPKWMHMTVISKHLELTPSQQDSIRKLKRMLRDSFEHYIPRLWSIEVHGMPQLAADVLLVIRFLALETGNYSHLTKSQKRKIKSLVYQGMRELTQSRLFRESQTLEHSAAST